MLEYCPSFHSLLTCPFCPPRPLSTRTSPLLGEGSVRVAYALGSHPNTLPLFHRTQFWNNRITWIWCDVLPDIHWLLDFAQLAIKRSWLGAQLATRGARVYVWPWTEHHPSSYLDLSVVSVHLASKWVSVIRLQHAKCKVLICLTCIYPKYIFTCSFD